MSKGVVFLAGFVLSLSAFAESYTFKELCEMKAEQTAHQVFAEDGWAETNNYSKILKRENLKNGATKIDVEMKAFWTTDGMDSDGNSLKGKKTSVYEVIYTIQADFCYVGTPKLVLDNEIEW